jgi:hypothetical protein
VYLIPVPKGASENEGTSAGLPFALQCAQKIWQGDRVTPQTIQISLFFTETDHPLLHIPKSLVQESIGFTAAQSGSFRWELNFATRETIFFNGSFLILPPVSFEAH